MPYGEHMRNLVTRCLNSSILHLSRNLGSENPLRLCLTCKVGVVPCVTLNANPPALLSHSKHESPPVLRVQVSIREHEEALVILKFNVLFQVIEDMSSVELFHLCVWPHSSADDFLLLEDGQA